MQATATVIEPQATGGAPSSTAPPTKTVTLHVEGDGIVEKKVGGDWVQVCDKAPCDLRVEPGAMVSLRVSKNGLAGADKKVVADHDQKLSLASPILPTGAKPPKPPIAGSVATPGANDLCEIYDEDAGIKLWRPCGKK